MLVIRSVLFYLGLLLSIIVLMIACLVMWPVVPLNRRYDIAGRTWARVVLWWLKVTCNITHRIRWVGDIPSPDEPVVVLAKHQSAWDPFLLGVALPYRLCFIYKKSLHWIPFFGWALMSMDMLAIDRAKGRESFQALVDKGRTKVRSGWAVAIFPEGTRVPMGQHVRYKTGGARFAVQTESTILTVTYNPGKCWPKNSFIKRPGVIDVIIGPSLQVHHDDDAQQITHNVERIIEDGLAQLS